MAKYGFTHLSSGDLLREEVASGSERGEQKLFYFFFAILGSLGIDFFGILSISPSSLGWIESQILTTI